MIRQFLRDQKNVEKEVLLIKTLLRARDILLEEAQMLSKVMDQTVNLTDFIFQLDDSKLFGSLFPADVSSTATDIQSQDQLNPEVAMRRQKYYGTFGVMECSCLYLRTVCLGRHI